jgi:hypothetical protein
MLHFSITTLAYCIIFLVGEMLFGNVHKTEVKNEVSVLKYDPALLAVCSRKVPEIFFISGSVIMVIQL